MHIGIETLPGPDNIIRRKLANGIVVLVRENPHVQSVVVAGALDAGSIFEPDSALGLAGFTALMLARGTEQRDFDAIHETLEGCGARLTFNSSRHTAGFSSKSLAEDLPLLLDLLADTLRQAVFPDDHVEKLRGQLVTNFKLRETDPRYMASRMFRELAYPSDHPYHRPIDGERETIMTISREQIADFHRQQYGPGGMFVVVVGAVHAETVIDEIAARFEDWENPTQRTQPDLPVMQYPSDVSQDVLEMPDKSQANLVLGVPALSRYAEDWHAANLANSILGVFGMYGRIGAEVREKRGLAYYCYSRVDGGQGPGLWRVVAGVNPADVGKTVDAIRHEIRRITTVPVTGDELADNKANFIGRLPLRLESNEGVASALVSMERYRLGLDYLQRYPGMIEALTVEDVLAASRHYLDPDVYALAIAGPELPAEREG